MGDLGNRCQAATTRRVSVLEVRLIGLEGAHEASAQGCVGRANSVGLGEDPIHGSLELTKGCLDPANSSSWTR
jgi:hypothetical protein